VCTKTTGHAEVVQVEFDPGQVSYNELLDVFWDVHDPTQVNRQGFDVGSNYRSAIFFHSPEQQEQALESKARVQGRYDRPIATEITPASDFWRAEEYHQQYLVKRGVASCLI
jgi:peptide-methionine (S)-S-oxide reductase